MVRASHTAFSFLLIMLGLLLFDFVPNLFSGVESSITPREIPAVQGLHSGDSLGEKPEFESKMSIFDEWSRKKNSEREDEAARRAANAAKRSPKIDKTIRPYFQKFGEDYQIGLSGLFFEQQPFAVVNKIKFADKASTYHRLQAGEELDGYKVTEINAKGITLDNGQQIISLILFNKESNGV